MLKDIKVVVRGAGDLATGIIYSLYQAGFKVVATEVANPLVVRRSVSFAEAIYQNEFTVEGITARRIVKFSEIEEVLNAGEVPVIADPKAEVIKEWQPKVVVDAIMAKRNIGTKIDDAEVVIGLGPGFTAQKDVDAVIETARGHNLGRVIKDGSAELNTGIPGEIGGYREKRVLKSTCNGEFTSPKKIGERIITGETFGYIANQEIKAEIDGVIRGLLKSGVMVREGTKLGDIDPRGIKEYCYTISDKARAIGGAVLTATLSLI
ncbi:MAG: xanthine dehydrogenase accessory factor [Candidatus Frackibacter sp. T328-2]|nr:MAG: xanthine dehydrogenase accessory factor [Candidatus Frackibacter sp. T328-2]